MYDLMLEKDGLTGAFINDIAIVYQKGFECVYIGKNNVKGKMACHPAIVFQKDGVFLQYFEKSGEFKFVKLDETKVESLLENLLTASMGLIKEQETKS